VRHLRWEWTSELSFKQRLPLPSHLLHESLYLLPLLLDGALQVIDSLGDCFRLFGQPEQLGLDILEGFQCEAKGKA